MQKALLIIILIIVVIAGAFFLLNRSKQSSQPPSTQTTTQTTITLTSNGFSPGSLTIKAGQKVTWINKSGTDATVNSDPHPVHTNYPPLNLGSFANGQSLTLIFNQTGSYGYHNHLNPNQHGTILVQ